jgi:REP element-mobilizing transposase RayT
VGRYSYFLTFCTSSRRSVFTRDDAVRRTLSQFLRLAGENGMKQIAYVFMPDHAHLLTRGLNETSDLRVFAHRVKQKTGFDYKRDRGERLWQPSFYDHVLRADEEEASIIRYMALNPVAAGMVKDPADYPYWGASDWTREEVLADLRAHPDDVWTPPPGYMRAGAEDAEENGGQD